MTPLLISNSVSSHTTGYRITLEGSGLLYQLSQSGFTLLMTLVLRKAHWTEFLVFLLVLCLRHEAALLRLKYLHARIGR
jgi:hypothetical protein